LKNFSPIKKNNILNNPFIFFILCVLGVIGSMMVNYGTGKYGIGVSPDSVGYISTAQSLLNRTGFHLFNGEPFVQWPPLYPLLLAALGLLGINPLVGAKYLM
jgi:hypothetical protein